MIDSENMSTSDYYDYASRFQKKIETVSGIIMYPDHEGIPQDVLLVPFKITEEKSLEQTIIEAVRIHGDKTIFTYFQNIKWIMPDLDGQLKNWPFLKGTFIGQHYFMSPVVRLSYGAITFDQTVIEQEPGEVDVHRQLCFEFCGHQFDIDVVEFPLQLGVPKLFTKLEINT
ncbi:hypothetical protein [Chitinophaga sp. Ak27]|uniref:hypothetical protein n=1 Tax=Chitinophaga sp. Ak27 TaxID=2726116 RepID=UPI00145F1C0A|nr:hypothetical protein [Chitinophaga sp. Ak27]NLU94910.1 hypothetical protein [Chitinophaga sp. Ak27]